MGLLGKAAKAAVNKAKKASKHYCPNTDNHKHKFGRHKNPDVEHDGRPVHGVTHITYCTACGWTDHKK